MDIFPWQYVMIYHTFKKICIIGDTIIYLTTPLLMVTSFLLL